MQDYLEWQSPLFVEQVFSSLESFSYPTYLHTGVVYLTQLKHEKNRSALVFKNAEDDQTITPVPFNPRTKVSEYGGKPFWVLGDALFFANQEDQCLYQQTITKTTSGVTFSAPRRVTAKPVVVVGECEQGSERVSTSMFTDVVAIGGDYFLSIVEQTHSNLNSRDENASYIGLFNINEPDKPPVPLVQGADFYSNLVFDPKSKRIAWVEWSHPAMPWDQNSLYIADLIVGGEGVSLSHKNRVPLAESASVCQLLFAGNGDLFFSADALATPDLAWVSKECELSNYWNIYCYRQCSESTGVARSYRLKKVTDMPIEFGYPHWQYGDARIVQYDQQHLLSVGSDPKGDRLFFIDQDSLTVTPVEAAAISLDASTLQSLNGRGSGQCLNHGGVMMVQLPSNGGARLVEFSGKPSDYRCRALLENKIPLDSADVSQAEHISFDCRDGGQANGFYYPPMNSSYTHNTEQAPPLIVMVHGGPTARAYGHFDIQKQFWTSRGFALFDVNHRGSSGYGRAYRDALYGQWGEVDCHDIVDGIDFLVKEGFADQQRICIRGKSAGGYAVLRALTEYPDVFKAGACYYGIGNLATLAESTHKFEKHYTDRLIGEEYQSQEAVKPSSRFYQRSPIHKVAALKSAMIVFQGSLDKVVPPEVAHEVVAVLNASGVDHEYIEYPDEAHGFRQIDNNIDAWTKELAFYRRILAS